MLDRLQSAQPRIERAYAALILLAVFGTTGYALSRAPSLVQTAPGAYASRAAHEPNDQQAPAKSAAGLAVGAVHAASDAEKVAVHYRALADHIDANIFDGGIYKSFLHAAARENVSSHHAERADINRAFD